jgi:hypothetical protein
VDTARTDDDGVYTLPLPAAGRYIVAMLHPVTHQAVARKLAVDNRSVTVDLTAEHLPQGTGADGPAGRPGGDPVRA